ncbi:MAG: divalent metal cation transporter [Flavobacteriales bacterium]
MKRIQSLKNTLGPGILFASTAIGVSHLVQSTKAGALFGFGLLWAVVAANVLKYPFFEFGSRYANATGTSIIEGYQKLSKWALWTYFIITVSSMFFVCAAVGKVTSGFMENLFQLNKIGLGGSLSSILIFMICGGILIIGKFKILDKLIKIIGLVLLISTLTAFSLCIFHGPVNKNVVFISYQSINSDAWFFLIPLMGWMPTAVDLSSWNSLWTVEKIKSSKYHPALKETLFEFNFGYIISGLLSICFITLGAFLIYGTSEVMETSSHLFANQVVNLYTKIFGNWSYIIIASSTFSIMFGTCIAVFDGYGRVLNKTTELLFPKLSIIRNKYAICVLILITGTFLITNEFEKSGDFGILVNFATSISFLIAPIIAVFNFLVVNKYLDKKFIPPKWLNYLAILGIIYLTLFSILYLFKNYLLA